MPVPAEYQRATEAFTAFLLDAREEAGLWSTHAAYTMTQGVFRTFRRRLTVEQALVIANALPVGLRALFVADWTPEPPVPFESPPRVIEEVRSLRPGHNFAPDTAVRDVGAALARHVDAAAWNRALAHLPDEARIFWEAGSQTGGETGGETGRDAGKDAEESVGG